MNNCGEFTLPVVLYEGRILENMHACMLLYELICGKLTMSVVLYEGRRIACKIVLFSYKLNCGKSYIACCSV